MRVKRNHRHYPPTTGSASARQLNGNAAIVASRTSTSKTTDRPDASAVPGPLRHAHFGVSFSGCPSPLGGLPRIVMHERCLFVRLCVCPLALLESAWPNFTKFLCMLPVSVGRSSSDGVGVRYVLLVLPMTSCFNVVVSLQRGQHCILKTSINRTSSSFTSLNY